MSTKTNVTTTWSNWLTSSVLVLAMGLILGLLGWSLGGVTGLLWLSLFGALSFSFAQRLSPTAVMRMQRARPITRQEAPVLYEMVARLAYRAKLPAMPEIYYVRTPMMNAFAVGRPDEAAIGVTDGLLRGLSERELRGVIAHEISHIASNDVSVMNLAGAIGRLTRGMSFVGRILLFINFPLLLMGQATISWAAILLLLFAPMLSNLLQLALSRTREYNADMGAFQLTGDAPGLMSALSKLERQGQGLFGRMMPTVALSSLIPEFMRTHPLTSERVRRLSQFRQTPVYSTI